MTRFRGHLTSWEKGVHDLARHGANALTAVIGFGDALPGCGATVLERDSWAAAVVDELKQKPQDIEVDKYRLSGF